MQFPRPLVTVSFMPIYLYWGSDEFAISKAVADLREKILDPDWVSFNFDKIPPDEPDGPIRALNQAMTPPFGSGGRLVWLVETTIAQQCSADLLAEMERTLGEIPESNLLLLTSSNKPDGRLKSTKLLQQRATIKEFSQIPPWQQDKLIGKVRQVADELGVNLSQGALEALADAVGNDTRSLYNELEKLKLYADSLGNGEIDERAIDSLVTCSTQSSFQLATAIRQGDISTALELVTELIHRNEPALRIVATLTSVFRTWLWVKLMGEIGERDERAIAKAAEIGNPKRIYFLRKEVSALSLEQLRQTLPVLLELEVSLKRGADELATLQTKVIELARLCRPTRQNSFR